MFHQYFQDPLDCSFVLLFHLCKDQNVIQVHHYDPLGYESSENVIHHSLEGGSERVQKGIVHWDKQNHAVPAPNCVLKVRGEIIKDEGL